MLDDGDRDACKVGQCKVGPALTDLGAWKVRAPGARNSVTNHPHDITHLRSRGTHYEL
jgi:hypothetical protein